MEYVEGETLAQVLRRLEEVEPETETPFGPNDQGDYFIRLARAFANIADGLQNAHSKGVIHRDIKPSNLILDGEGRLRILDFGLARLEGQESLTFSGDIVGTPAYMSPEQARRKKIPVDHRTDIYSLGATLYELLTHQQPFYGKDHNDTLSQIIERDPRPPRQLNGRVPQDLETIVLKCLCKEAADRYGTAEALGQDLRRFGRGDAIEARQEPPLDKLRRRLWRSRSRIAALAGALLLALVSLLLAVNYKERERERTEREQVRKETDYRDLVTRAVIEIPAAGPTLGLVQMGGAHEQRHILHLLDDDGRTTGIEESTALVHLEAAANLLPQRPEAHYQRARFLWFLGREAEAAETLDRLIDLTPDFAPARSFRAAVFERQGRKELAERELEAVRKQRASAWAEDWFQAQQAAAVENWKAAAAAYRALARKTPAGGELFAGSWLEVRLGRAVAHLEAGDVAGAHDDCVEIQRLYPESLLPAFLVGHTWVLMGHRDAAQSSFRNFIRERNPPEGEVYKFLLGLRQPSRGTAILWLEAMPGTVARDRMLMLYLAYGGEAARAIDVGRQVLKMRPDDPLLLAFLGFVATLAQGAQRDVEDFLRQAAEGGSGDGYVCLLLGYAYHLLGEYSEAEKWARRAVALKPDFTWARIRLANVLKFRGKIDESIESLKACLERQPRESQFHAELGALYRNQGLFAQAHASLGEALRLEPESSPLIHVEIGGVYEFEGRLEEAEAHYRKAVRAEPHFAENHAFHARVLWKMGRFDKALRAACQSLLAWGNHANTNARITHRVFAELLRWKPRAAPSPQMDELVDQLEAYTQNVEELPHVLESLALLYLYAPDRKDPSIAAEYAGKALRMNRSAPLLATLATTEVANDRLSDAVRTMERAVSLPDHEEAHLDQLAEYRRALLPDFASCASIDAALEGIAPYQDDGGRITELLEAVTEPSLRAYYDGRLLELEGKHEAASQHYKEALRLDELAVSEPRARLAHALASGGRPAEAEERLRLWITGDGHDDEEAWNAWITVSFNELGWSPSQVLSRSPDTEGKESLPSLAADSGWLLERLAEGEPIRINCGGDEDYSDPDGNLWSRDRFFRGGRAVRRWPKRVTGSGAEMLYVTERLFRESHLGVGYRMPLPTGRYRLTLHFAEVFRRGSGVRVFDVAVEGRTELSKFEPLENGYGVAWLKVMEIDIVDGRLDIEFTARKGKPKISAIELERFEN